MKTLRFRKMSLLSLQESRARRFIFQKQKMIVQGENSTGKSVLLKNLYATLGAIPHSFPTNWKNAASFSHLYFLIDENEYSVLFQDRNWAFFNNADALLAICHSQEEAARFVNNLLGIDFSLITGKGQLFLPPTPFHFAPFYIDQDNGWLKAWTSFAGLSKFDKIENTIVEFHTGIKPREYYRIKEKFDNRTKTSKKIEAEIRNLTDIYEDIVQSLPSFGQVLSIEHYKEEVDFLVSECIQLQNSQEEYSKKYNKHKNTKASLEVQLKIAEATYQEINDDYNFALKNLDAPNLQCPTCGAEYENSLPYRFGMKHDLENTNHIISEIKKKIRLATEQLKNIEHKIGIIRLEAARVKELLENKHGDTSLLDVVASKSRILIDNVLLTKINNLKINFSELANEIEDYRKEMDRYTSNELRHKVTKHFRESLQKNLISLNITQELTKDYINIHGKINESGSKKPRAVLSYFYAIIYTIEKYGTHLIGPIVIDAPRQQDIDDKNWKDTVAFIVGNTPPAIQLFLSAHSADDIPVDEETQIISLDTKDAILKDGELMDVYIEMKPFIHKMLHGDPNAK